MTELTIAPLLSPQWLIEHLDDPQVAIADCRFSLADPNLGRQQYQTNHIPGAYYFDLNRDLSSPVGQHGGRHPLPDSRRLAQTLAALGMDSTDPNRSKLVVAYDDSRFAFAARFWWLLKYFGYDRVAILDGGFQAWQAAGYPVTQDIPQAQMGQFVPRLRPDLIVDINVVKARKDNPGVILVDSREEERYRGEREPIDPIAGHIPGAVNYPWQAVTNEQGFGRSPEEQQQRWSELKDAEEVIVYCGSGVTACVNLVSMAIAGLPMGKLYVGSWSDWCSYCEKDEK
ncbi:sulfurtransferase [Oscillatoria sp. FACHB-1407]|uniref:sulfurtransferase n=1 Tax=Oscillatoria sp. FACHB-1407 TaxID=2692847 RepID=UPI001686ACD7|nr:sulfurtransferase [Oscillatoria sp. FACHB-1407]MBD2460420.1 sulfurtransferase [Oscillatoria sp. FACHB-1407]